MPRNWDPEQLDLWHRLWVEHLTAQRGLNPDHPSGPNDVHAYHEAALTYRRSSDTGPGGGKRLWHGQLDLAETRTQHDLVAALEVFNEHAGKTTAHMGLTSCDITDVANQVRLAEGFHEILGTVRDVIAVLDGSMVEHVAVQIVARTHGRPAQLTTYGHRIATVLGPLCDWYDRAARASEEYPMRPPYGAVGTAADLARVLAPKAPERPLEATGSPSGHPMGILTPPEVPGAPETLGGVWQTVHRSFLDHGFDGQQAVELADRTVDSIRQHGLTEEVTQSLRHNPLTDPASSAHTSYAGNDAVRDDARGGTPYKLPEPPTYVTTAPHGGHTYNTSEALDVYTAQIAARMGFTNTMDVTRQVYHRSYDQHLANLLSELASIAQTWATDRRLEAMLGLGAETPINGQVGSSAMPHKNNPIRCERMCALAVLTRSYQHAFAETAGMEWFEGDVSTSAARRVILPGMLGVVRLMLDSWGKANARWSINERAIDNEIHRYQLMLSTGALMQAAIDAGLDRATAHQVLLTAHRQCDDMADSLAMQNIEGVSFLDVLVRSQVWPLTAAQSQQVIFGVVRGHNRIGNVAEQIQTVHAHAEVIYS